MLGMLNKGLAGSYIIILAGKITMANTSEAINKAGFADDLELLVIKAKQGDKLAMEQLCVHICKSVLNRVIYAMGNSLEAEYVTQEVLVCVCRNIKNLREPKAFSSWLQKIIINKINNYQLVSSGHTDKAVSINEFYGDIDEEESTAQLPQDVGENKEFCTAISAATLVAAASTMPATSTIPIVPDVTTASTIPIAPDVTTASTMPVAPDVTAASTMPVASDAHAVSKRAAASLAGVVGAAIIAASAIGVGVILTRPPAKPPPIPVVQQVTIEGSIEFSGGISLNEDIGYINPVSASPNIRSSDGEVTVLSWWITEINNKEILFEGIGIDADEVLKQMQLDLMSGEYEIFFKVECESGTKYSLGRSFLILQ